MKASSQKQILLDTYWAKRLKMPRIGAVAVAIGNLWFQYGSLRNPYHDQNFYGNLVMTVLIFLALLLIIPSYCSPVYNKYVRYGFMIVSLRQVIYVYDVLGTRYEQDYEEWILFGCVELICATYALHYHFHYFNSDETGHFIFALVQQNLIMIGTLFMIFNPEQLKQKFIEDDVVTLTVLLVFTQLLTLQISRSESVHNEHIQQIFEHLQDQEFLKIVLNNYNEPMIMLNDQCKITYSNPLFRDVFGKSIAYSSGSMREPRGTNLSNFTFGAANQPEPPMLMKDYLRRNSKHIIKRIRQQWDAWKETSILNLNEETNIPDNFYTLKMFIEAREAENEEEGHNPEGHRGSNRYLQVPNKTVEDMGDSSLLKYSIQDIYREDSNLEDITLKVIDFAAASAISEPASGPPESAREVYMKVKLTKLQNQQGQQRTMLSFIDISDTVLYGKSKEQNEMLSILNATVSHELRNPLNSIVGQNILKENLYQDMKIVLYNLQEKIGPNSREMRDIKGIMRKLVEGLKIQDASARMMSFLVQDFLDYAQIKSGKFRINLTQFNIRETIDKVMCIQKEKAMNTGIEFYSTFKNISEQYQPNEQGVHIGEMIWNSSRTFSPEMITDEQRVMQVLLNLQSNALKFTQRGKVEIQAEILQEEEGKYLKVSVCDTGVGIPYEDQDKLFQLFGFLTGSKQLNQNGIGLGLVISEKIVNKFGGQIGFESKPFPEEGHGTTFFFTMLLETKENYEKQKLAANLAEQKYSMNSKEMVFHDWKPPEGKREQNPFRVPEDEENEPQEQKERQPKNVEIEVEMIEIDANSEVYEEDKTSRPTGTGLPQFKLKTYNGECLVNQWSISKEPLITGNSRQIGLIEESEMTLSDLNPDKIADRISQAELKRRQEEEQAAEEEARLEEVARLAEEAKREEEREIAEIEQMNENEAAMQMDKILIVDDQMFNINAIEAIIVSKFNIPLEACERALNGEQALNIVRGEYEMMDMRGRPKPPKYKLILMDCNMPFMDGFKCTQAIRSFYYVDLGLSIKNQPIISAVTGHAEPKYIKRCFDYGMNQVLSKPVDQEALMWACIEAGFTTEEEILQYQAEKERKASFFKLF